MTCQPHYHYNQLTEALCCCPSSTPLHLYVVCVHSVKHAYYASAGMQHQSCRLDHMCKEYVFCDQSQKMPPPPRPRPPERCQNQIHPWLSAFVDFHKHCMKLLFTGPNNLEVLDMFSGQLLTVGHPCCESSSKHERLWHTFGSGCEKESTLIGSTSRERTREHNTTTVD